VTSETPPATWRKSTRSGANGCVEVQFANGQVSIRDSKNRRGPVLDFTPLEWEAFVGGVKNGEFDLSGPSRAMV
jgi:hypothetical protein